MKATIKQYNPDDEFYMDENCYITELANTADDNEVSIARARVEPGITTRWHRLHNVVERYYIISGVARVEVADLPACDVHAGDTITIPALCRQRITNIGNEDLIFLAICTPRFTPKAYEDIEDEISQ